MGCVVTQVDAELVMQTVSVALNPSRVQDRYESLLASPSLKEDSAE